MLKRSKILIIVIVSFGIAFHCKNFANPENAVMPVLHELIQIDIPQTSAIELSFIDAGLVDVNDFDTTIMVDLAYGKADNFVGVNFYGGFNNAYLQPEVAEMLVKAQRYLRGIDSSLVLCVLDAARPRWVQQMMWDSVKPPPGMFKGFLVSNPANGSVHNYGCAVDVTICHKTTKLPLDMGSPFDYFGPEAYPVEEERMLKSGKLTYDQIKHRKLLRKVMYKAGFFNIQTEWWHFNACHREAAKQKYHILE
ncbi:MAG: M15 family metallopeptidase [Bacteroidales bacterium]|nr:M15 family metallopeptidase [Bacteroidales bacterium]